MQPIHRVIIRHAIRQRLTSSRTPNTEAMRAQVGPVTAEMDRLLVQVCNQHYNFNDFVQFIQLIRICVFSLMAYFSLRKPIYQATYYFQISFVGVISAGVSVPVQIPSQGADISSSYWPRLQ